MTEDELEQRRARGRANYLRNKAAYVARAVKWAADNREKRNAIVRKFWAKRRAADPEKERAKERARYARDKRRINERNRAWITRHAASVRVYQACFQNRRRATKLQATPAWADHEAIKDVYLEAAYQGMTVDHIVPLKGRTVCGLHWEGNLQLLTQSQNSAKGNRLLDNAHTL